MYRLNDVSKSFHLPLLCELFARSLGIVIIAVVLETWPHLWAVLSTPVVYGMMRSIEDKEDYLLKFKVHLRESGTRRWRPGGPQMQSRLCQMVCSNNESSHAAGRTNAYSSLAHNNIWLVLCVRLPLWSMSCVWCTYMILSMPILSDSASFVLFCGAA